MYTRSFRRRTASFLCACVAGLSFLEPLHVGICGQIPAVGKLKSPGVCHGLPFIRRPAGGIGGCAMQGPSAPTRACCVAALHRTVITQNGDQTVLLFRSTVILLMRVRVGDATLPRCDGLCLEDMQSMSGSSASYCDTFTIWRRMASKPVHHSWHDRTPSHQLVVCCMTVSDYRRSACAACITFHESNSIPLMCRQRCNISRQRCNNTQAMPTALLACAY